MLPGEMLRAPAEAVTFAPDLFVIHADADESFVHGYLLPAVGLPPERVLLSCGLPLGAPRAAELEHGVLSSKLTVVVVSPAYTADRLAVFAEQLAGYASGVGGRMVPLLRTDCEVPLRLEFLEPLDFRDPARWAEEAQRLRAHLQQPAQAQAPAELPCPYPGMRMYSADLAAHFHGRDAEIDEILGRLRSGERELYVIGPSGSGKSSLVVAGVLPRLARGVPGIRPFLPRLMRPGEHPIARLRQVLEVPEAELAAPASAIDALLAPCAPGTSVLLVIDQLEELFTLTGRDERARFMVSLRALRAEPRCVLVFGLRADFFGAFMESTLWTDLHGRISHIEVAPLRGDALRAAITEPARDVGVFFEPELVERLLTDAAGEPGVLPLLQETLVQLWGHRRFRLLTLADYQALGDRDRSGLAVALSRRADASLRALTPAQELIARRILLRLINFGEGRADTRRQQRRSKLRAAGDNPAEFDAVLRHLVDDCLLTIDDSEAHEDARVDLAHEVMIAAWPTLAGWIRTRRAAEQRRRQLEAAAIQWVEHGRGATGLLDSIELAEAEAWRRTDPARELGENAEVAELVVASRAALDRQRRRRRRLVAGAFTTLAAFTAVVATLAVIAWFQAIAAEAGRRRSQQLLALSYQEAGRQLVLDGHPQEAIPYLLAAREQGLDGAPLHMLFWAATRSLPIVPPLEHRGVVRRAAFSPDGTRVVTASGDRTARIWDAVTGEPLATLHHEGTVNSAAFDARGTRVVTASDDGSARIWNAATGQPLTVPALEHDGPVLSAAFSHDGTRVVTASNDTTARVWDAATGKRLASVQHEGTVRSAAFDDRDTRVVTASDDHTARVWDAATDEPLTPPLTHGGWVNSAAFDPRGTRVVTASDDGSARVWDAATGKRLAIPALEHEGPVLSAAFSPDGTRIVTASDDGSARVWDAATGKHITDPLRHEHRVNSATFSPDGTRVVTASDDGSARVWDATTGKPITAPLQHQGDVRSAAFNPDGTRVVTAGDDHTARIWDAATGKRLTTPLEHRGTVRHAAFSPRDTLAVTAGGDGTAIDKGAARIWDPATGKPLAPLPHRGIVNHAAFSPDGTRVVTASEDQSARVWDPATGRLLTRPLAHEGWVSSAAFDARSTRVVTASFDKTARIWDAVTGQRLATFHHEGTVNSAVFDDQGARVVTASDDTTAQIWDAVTRQRLVTLPHPGWVNSAAFSPDGTRVVTASNDGAARIWDAATGEPRATLPHQGAVTHAAFSADGHSVVTASDDHTARVWDAATGEPLATPLQHRDAVKCAAFSTDGSRVVTASLDTTARIWDAATGKPLTPPLEHRGAVKCAAFSTDGSRVITASDDTAHLWEIPLDHGTLAEWRARAERGPFVLRNGVLALRRVDVRP